MWINQNSSKAKPSTLGKTPLRMKRQATDWKNYVENMCLRDLYSEYIKNNQN